MGIASEIPPQLVEEIRSKALNAARPRGLTPEQQGALSEKIQALLEKNNAVLITHYYVDEQLQILTDATGGYVGDSLGMADYGNRHPATTLVVVGVRFMGESAKILNPEKRVIMPDLAAECSLDLSCPIGTFSAFCDEHPDRTVVVYANTSAEVKARSDWVVTSSNAVDIVAHLRSKGEKVIFAPDRHLGNYVQNQTGADILNWQGFCVVHDEFKAKELQRLMQENPDAEVIAHPESPAEVLDMAHAIGSTTQLINAAKASKAKTLIVATDFGLFHKMHEAAPDKQLMAVPTGGDSASCVSCAHCPWMAMNSLENLAAVLENGAGHEIEIDESVRKKALIPIERMLEFSRSRGNV
ncbi:MAG: quinolinate synthase NadA [Gammaproteobacteria bacterium]|nr:quinolinate synthase NadA [Gammaproteobacteria bacterium]